MNFYQYNPRRTCGILDFYSAKAGKTTKESFLEFSHVFHSIILKGNSYH